MRILMMFGSGTPSACERSRTETPDSTLMGPLGGGAGGPLVRPSGRSGAFRRSPGRPPGEPAPSMTTRRLRRPLGAPCLGRMGLLGRFGSAISASVEARELWIDGHGKMERSPERAPVARPLEAHQPRARVDAPARRAVGGRDETAVPRAEAQE